VAMSMREMGAPTAPMPLVKLSGAPGAPAAPGAGQQLEAVGEPLRRKHG